MVCIDLSIPESLQDHCVHSLKCTQQQSYYRAAAFTSQNHVTKYFCNAKEHRSSMAAEEKLLSHVYSRLRSCSVKIGMVTALQ